MKRGFKAAEAAIEQLKAGDVRGVEPAIGFLNADVYEFRSGYLKEYLWRYLHRVPLTDRQKERLFEVANKYLQRQIGREFWQMCRVVSQVADAEFSGNVRALAQSSKDDGVRQRAALLAAYLYGLEEGEKARRKFTRKVRYGEDIVTSGEV
jgi:hypothetical protein